MSRKICINKYKCFWTIWREKYCEPLNLILIFSYYLNILVPHPYSILCIHYIYCSCTIVGVPPILLVHNSYWCSTKPVTVHSVQYAVRNITGLSFLSSQLLCKSVVWPASQSVNTVTVWNTQWGRKCDVKKYKTSEI